MGAWGAIGAALGTSALSLAEKAFNRKQDYNYQKKLRKSEYSDTMYDMKNAGLNPILAGKVGGNSTPSVSGGQSSQGVQTGINSALAKEQLNLIWKQSFKETQMGNYYKQLAEIGKKDNWFKGIDQDLLIRRLPSYRSAASFYGSHPGVAKYNEGLQMAQPTLQGFNSAFQAGNKGSILYKRLKK